MFFGLCALWEEEVAKWWGFLSALADAETLRAMSLYTPPPPPLASPCIQIQIVLLSFKVHTGMGSNIVNLFFKLFY